MQEIAGTRPLTYQLAPPPALARPPVTQVAGAAPGGGAGSATDGQGSLGAGAGQSRDPLKWDRPDRFTLTGPTPAFQASILEVERDFRNIIARIEANRAKAEADEAFGLEPAVPAGASAATEEGGEPVPPGKAEEPAEAA